jgi:hypothetical protein
LAQKTPASTDLGALLTSGCRGLVLTKWCVKSLPLGWAWIRSSGSLTHGLMCQFQALKTRRQGSKRLSLTSQEPGFLHNSNANSCLFSDKIAYKGSQIVRHFVGTLNVNMPRKPHKPSLLASRLWTHRSKTMSDSIEK